MPREDQILQLLDIVRLVELVNLAAEDVVLLFKFVLHLACFEG